MFKNVKSTIGRKIIGIIVLCFLGGIATTFFTIAQMRANLYALKRSELTHLTQLALEIVKDWHAAAQKGATSEEEAQKRAATRLRSMRYGNGDYFWINDTQYRMIMHPVTTALEGKDVSNLKDANGTYFLRDLVDAAKRDGGGFVAYEYARAGYDRPQAKLSAVIGFAPWGWVIGTGGYTDDLQQQLWNATRAALIVSVIVLIFVGGIAVLMARRMSLAVRSSTAAMKQLAAGALDIELPRKSRRDEVGEMADALAVFKANSLENRRLLAEQQEAGRRLAEERRLTEEREAEERVAAEERQDQATKEAMHKVVGEFESAVGSIVGVVSASATELEATASGLTDTARSTQQLSNAVAAASEEASTNVQTVASAAEQMTASVLEISNQVQHSTEIAHRAVSQAEQTDARVNELSKAASRIGDVVKLITAIAEQTNLLALNATIEAARAGDAGKGFAVVAQEVKALAAQTAKATGEIGAQITDMQSATQDSVMAIKEISATINKMSEIAGTIASAVEEQGAATREIARNVEEAAKGTTLVSSKISEVSRHADETGASSDEMLAAAQSLAREGNQLKTEMEQFLHMIRTGLGNRRRADDPNYTGLERRIGRSAISDAAS
jgi:methyl-accepting chemotaxis protein